MAKFRELVEHLEFDELQKINNDINTGAVHMKRIIENRLRHKEVEHGHTCSVCMNSIDPLSVNNFTLVFGPTDFKKKASFCGFDCLKYFLSNIEGIKNTAQQTHDQHH